MAVIGMVGMHALGKSTALLRWKKRYGDRLKAYSLDDMRKTYNTNEEKIALVEKCRMDSCVCVIKSARGFAAWLSSFLPTEPVIVVWCTESVARKNMVIRRKGKTSYRLLDRAAT